jgi:hypothetical protein
VSWRYFMAATFFLPESGCLQCRQLPTLLEQALHLLLESTMPNLSVKGTSCGKPQAAPYLER